MQFSDSNGISGIFFSQAHPGEFLTANIMDLSIGGMGIIFKEDFSGRLNRGDILILSEILHMQSLGFMKNIKMEIRWAGFHPSGQFEVGCEFFEISADCAEKLKKVLDSWKIRIILNP